MARRLYPSRTPRIAEWSGVQARSLGSGDAGVLSALVGVVPGPVVGIGMTTGALRVPSPATVNLSRFFDWVAHSTLPSGL